MLRVTRRLVCAVLLLCTSVPAVAEAASGWAPTGSMADVRRAHVAAELRDGRVLAVSGFSGSGEVPSAELYDPATGTWSAAAPPLVPRHYATATRLPDGRVLVAGGFTAGGVTAQAELYDPAANTWTATGSLTVARNGHVATALADGRVLVAGGAPGSRDAWATGEIYDPATGTWTAIPGTMSAGREYAAIALLPGGEVLVAGGFDLVPSTTFSATADRYDPVANTWTPTGSLATSRGQAASATLRDGRVVVAGGVRSTGFVTSVEVYDPAAGTWATQPGTVPSGNIAFAARLEGGAVLVTSDGSRSTPLLDPATGLVSGPALLATTRALPSLTRLADGRVLIAGGSNLASAELFTPPTTRSATSPTFAAAGEREVTITNTGTERLRVAGASITGADFQLAGTTCTAAPVLPGATCMVRVRFAPTAPGTRTGSLVLDDNAEASGPIALSAPAAVGDPGPVPGTEPPTPGPAAPLAPLPPTPPAATPAKPRSTPAVCGSRRRIVVSLGLRRRDRVRSGTVTVNGRRIARLRRTSRSAVVDLRRRPYGTYVVRVRLRTSAGRTVAFTRTYRTCRVRARS